MPRSTKAAVPLSLPPYGYMVGYQLDGAIVRAQPVKWNADARAWDQWFTRLLALIGENVWPVYVNGAWARSPAADNAMDLTAADLDAIREFRSRHFLATIGTSGLYHADLLATEDEGPGWPAAIGTYCPELAAPAFNLAKLFEHGIYDYAERFLPESFKLHFQRPRPYQAAFILEPAIPFRHTTAKSANTPALISGHAVQALIVGCVVYESILADAQLAGRNRKALQAWMTGAGDRRVMAGVHYPTDSLASWLVASEMVDYLFADPAIRAFLLEAIRESLLYRFLEPRAGATRAFKLPWSCLQRTLAKSSSKALPEPSGTSVPAPRKRAKPARRA